MSSRERVQEESRKLAPNYIYRYTIPRIIISRPKFRAKLSVYCLDPMGPAQLLHLLIEAPLRLIIRNINAILFP